MVQNFDEKIFDNSMMLTLTFINGLVINGEKQCGH